MNMTISGRWVTISNALSIGRLVATPFIVKFLIDQCWREAFILFIIASVSDLLDGYIARVFHEQTVLGQYLDPLADKVLLLSCFCTFGYMHIATVPLPLWFIVLALVREAIIVCGGTALVMLGKGRATAPSFLGKLTTAVYMCLITWMFVCHFAGWQPCKTFYCAVIVAATLAASSLIQYCIRAVQLFIPPSSVRRHDSF